MSDSQSFGGRTEPLCSMPVVTDSVLSPAVESPDLDPIKVMFEHMLAGMARLESRMDDYDWRPSSSRIPNRPEPEPPDIRPNHRLVDVDASYTTPLSVISAATPPVTATTPVLGFQDSFRSNPNGPSASFQSGLTNRMQQPEPWSAWPTPAWDLPPASRPTPAWDVWGSPFGKQTIHGVRSAWDPPGQRQPASWPIADNSRNPPWPEPDPPYSRTTAHQLEVAIPYIPPLSTAPVATSSMPATAPFLKLNEGFRSNPSGASYSMRSREAHRLVQPPRIEQQPWDRNSAGVESFRRRRSTAWDNPAHRLDGQPGGLATTWDNPAFRQEVHGRENPTAWDSPWARHDGGGYSEPPRYDHYRSDRPRYETMTPPCFDGSDAVNWRSRVPVVVGYEFSDNEDDLLEADNDDAEHMEEDIDGDLADIEALNYDDLDNVSKLQKTQRFTDVMQKVEDALDNGSENSTHGIVLEDDPEYQLKVDCNALSVDIENENVIIHNFIRDKYRLKFPVLESLGYHPIDYARVVKKIAEELLGDDKKRKQDHVIDRDDDPKQKTKEVYLLEIAKKHSNVQDALGEWSCPKYVGIWNCIVCITKKDDTDEKSKKAKNAFFSTVDVLTLHRLCASLEHLHTFDPGGEVSPKLMFAMLFIVSWFPP